MFSGRGSQQHIRREILLMKILHATIVMHCGIIADKVLGVGLTFTLVIDSDKIIVNGLWFRL